MVAMVAHEHGRFSRLCARDRAPTQARCARGVPSNANMVCTVVVGVMWDTGEQHSALSTQSSSDAGTRNHDTRTPGSAARGRHPAAPAARSAHTLAHAPVHADTWHARGRTSLHTAVDVREAGACGAALWTDASVRAQQLRVCWANRAQNDTLHHGSCVVPRVLLTEKWCNFAGELK